ncbi:MULTISPECIES: hypothetical protein [unclassified Mesorhizobium]|uniref:hypothetical protein n=1 Tax=unclassified Mesorhizobium TaxID=325217 RepID=UPI00333656EB
MSENPYLLERYKYILDQKKELNKTTFIIAAFYQAVLVAILAAQFSIVKGVADRSLSSDLARLGSWGLFWCAVAVSAICIAALISGLFAWLNYREDESEIEVVAFGKSRKPVRFRDALRWYESYIIVSIFFMVLVYLVALYKIVLPLL